MGIPTDDRSPFDDTPSYEELKELVGALRLLTEQQSAQIAGLEAEIAKLKERLGRNPRNTSMPPSAEGRTKPPAGNRAERRAPTPPEAIAPACYGPGIRALAVYLSVYQHVPHNRGFRLMRLMENSP